MNHYLNLQSKFFLWLSLITIAIAFLFSSNSNTHNFLLLILMIALLGVPHGALDTLFAKKAFELNTHLRWVKFVLIYLVLSLLVFTFWLLFPTPFFIIFLAFSALHFADDIGHIKTKSLSILYGLNIILLPTILQKNQLITLYGYIIEHTAVLLLLKVMQPLAIIITGCTLMICIIKKKQIEMHHKIDILSVSLLLLLVHPLISFTVYFCFMHSLRHVIRAKFYFLEQSNQRFLLMLVVPTIAVLLFCIVMFSNMPTNQWDANLIKLTFVTLAALTFPHAFLLNKVGFMKSIKR